MDKQRLSWLKLISLGLKQLNKTLAICFLVILGDVALTAKAQIIPDNTLGIENSTIRAVILNDLPSTQIEGGAVRDSLLFHSFQEFNIDEGHGAYFFNPDDISTIFSRVTGSNSSNLLGTLGVLGSADLVFLNPNGVLFGPNSELDIEGSFTATTANEIVFPNGEVFSAGIPEVPSLIENNLVAPIGLIFEGPTFAPIVSQGNLSVGKDLTLSAHTISAQGELLADNDLTLQAEDTVQIRDSADRAFVAIAGNILTITGQNQVDIFALNHPQSILASGGDMTLQSANPVLGDAHYVAGGSFRIEDLAGELAPLISEVDPIIATANDVELGGYTGASLHILAGGQVLVTGDIEITGPDATATS
nr:filamentous hemagglutinin N-terminal domain-containing protein [Leptolyngbyaceae cyanobacterium MAG.088]